MDKIKHTLTLTLFSAFGLCGFAASGWATPNPTALLISVLNHPSQAYQGQMMVSYWSETGSKAEDVKIYFSPPNNYRFEFLTPEGKVDRVVMSNGAVEKILIMNGSQFSESFSTHQPPRQLSVPEENKLLTENYKVTSLASEKIIDRDTWAIELTPLAVGKPHQIMRIDRATNVILEIKRYMPEGKTGSITRFTQFLPSINLPGDLFIQDGSFTQETDETNFQTAKLTGDANSAVLLPTKLYGGFSLETGNQFEVNGNSIKHLRYSDGLLPVSIFESPLPVKTPDQRQSLVPWNRPLEMGTSNSGNVYQWKKDQAYFIMIGDVQQDFLKQIAGHLQ